MATTSSDPGPSVLVSVSRLADHLNEAHGPNWLMRYVYRLMIPAGVWLARAEPDQQQPPRGG